MDVYNEDVLDLWRVLIQHQVRFILVGGFAVNLHKHYRTTGDVDLYVEDTEQNRDRLGLALEDLRISTRAMIARMQFVPGWSIMHLQNGFPLDIMMKVKGLEYLSFDECYNLASTAHIDDVEVKFLHFDHLLQSKKAANRPKDQIDIIALEEIKRVEEAGE